jgi:hypothetical protein
MLSEFVVLIQYYVNANRSCFLLSCYFALDLGTCS